MRDDNAGVTGVLFTLRGLMRRMTQNHFSFIWERPVAKP